MTVIPFKGPNPVLKSLNIDLAAGIIIGRLCVEKDKTIRFYESSPGVCLPVFIDGRNCTLISEGQALRKIRQTAIFSLNVPGTKENFKRLEVLQHMSSQNAKAVLKTAMLDRHLIIDEPIKTFAFKSDPALAFHRVDFDPLPDRHATPYFDRCVENFTNSKAIRTWIGSLFVSNSNRTQYLWLYGSGGNGKSSLKILMTKALGNDSVRTEQAPAKDDKYWTFGLIGKRLIILDDCNNYGFVKVGLFKAITGSSRVRVEQKYGDPFDTDLDCKFFFTSNEKPLISHDEADKRRAIFCSAKNSEKFEYDPEFDTRLAEEIPFIVSNCLLDYADVCADGRPIPADGNELEELADDFNEDVAAWIDGEFKFDPNSHIKIANFVTRLASAPMNLNKRLVYSYLERRGVTKKLVRNEQEIYRALVGLCAKNSQ